MILMVQYLKRKPYDQQSGSCATHNAAIQSKPFFGLFQDGLGAIKIVPEKVGQ